MYNVRTLLPVVWFKLCYKNQTSDKHFRNDNRHTHTRRHDDRHEERQNNIVTDHVRREDAIAALCC